MYTTQHSLLEPVLLPATHTHTQRPRVHVMIVHTLLLSLFLSSLFLQKRMKPSAATTTFVSYALFST